MEDIKKRIMYEDVQPHESIENMIEEMVRINCGFLRMRFLKCKGKGYDDIVVTIKLVTKNKKQKINNDKRATI